MRLPTWLRLGLKIAGYGILGHRFISRLILYEAAYFNAAVNLIIME